MNYQASTAKQGPVKLGGSVGVTQQKRLQSRRQTNATKPEEAKTKKTALLGYRTLDSKQSQMQQNLESQNEQFASRQEQTMAHSNQSSFNNPNQRKNMAQNLVGAVSFQSLANSQYLTEKFDAQLAKAQNQKQNQQRQAAFPSYDSKSPFQSSITGQKKAPQPKNGTATNQKRQARTTHHSRQISWNRDQSHDLTNPKVQISQQSQQDQIVSQPSVTSQKVTAAQKANQSQKSKMTQSILKRLKESIDQGQVVTNAIFSSSGVNSVLPSQISDAYLTSQTKKSSQKTTSKAHGATKDQLSANLQTILEQNSNQKAVKTFAAPESTLAQNQLVQKPSKVKTNSSFNGAMPQSLQSSQNYKTSAAQVQQVPRQRQMRSKDSVVYQRQGIQKRQSQSPTEVTAKAAGQVGMSCRSNEVQTHVNFKVGNHETNAVYHTHRISDAQAQNNNPYLTQEHANMDQTKHSTRVETKPALKPSKMQTKGPKKGFQADQQQMGMVLKKAQIVTDGQMSGKSVSLVPRPKESAKNANNYKQTTIVQTLSYDMKRQSMPVNKNKGAFAIKIANTAQNRYKSGANSSTRYKNHAGNEVNSSLEKGASGFGEQEAFDGSKKQKQMDPTTKSVLQFINQGKPTLSKHTQPQYVAQEPRVTRKAKTSYARTPASYRSISGGKPSAQVFNQSRLSQQEDISQTNFAGTITSSPQANSHQMQAAQNQNVTHQAQSFIQQVKQNQGQIQSKTRQNQFSRDQLAYQQAISQGKANNATSFGSLQSKQQPQMKGNSKLPKPVSKGGNHKRSVSFKGNQKVVPLMPQTHVNLNPGSHLQGTSQSLNSKFNVNINYEQVLKNLQAGLKKPGPQKGSQIQQNLVSPFRTKQPSINNSRRISKERDVSRHSQNSVHSPRPQFASKQTIVKDIKKNASWQQSSFLTKANSKSMHSTSMNSQNQQATTEVQKLLKSYIKNAQKKIARESIGSQNGFQQAVVTRSHILKPNQSKTKTSSVTSQSNVSKQQRTYNQRVIQQVLGGQQSSLDDIQTMAQEHSSLTTFNAQTTKDQRTFQENRDRREDQMLVGNSSFQNASAGFAPLCYESQGKMVSGFNEHDIISGTFIATKSNEKIKVYPEEVKEQLLSHMPQRTRINGLPTSHQLQASSFENQVTMKRGDQLQSNQPSEQLEQVSVLDRSYKASPTPRSEDNTKQVIFQAFDEYVGQESAQDFQQRPNMSGETQDIYQQVDNRRQVGKRDKQLSNAIIREFDFSPNNGGGPVIDFHPSQQLRGDQNMSPMLTDNANEMMQRQRMGEHSQMQNNHGNHMNLMQDLVDETGEHLSQFNFFQNQQIDSQRSRRQEQSVETSSDEYESEIAMTEVFDPLLEDKQYLVTMIVTHFQEMGQPIATTHEFYRIGNKLGEGAFGKVCIAQHKLSGHFVAIKCMRKKDLNKQVECKKKMAQDMQILQHLTHHKNVVKLYDSFETSGHLCFVMEICAGGDLLSFVRRRKKLDETMAKFLFKQVALGLAYCHRNLVLHRDIKLENLLLDDEGFVKICDFGVSQLLADGNDKVKDQCGTPAYMAPEVFQCTKEFSGQQADVWSLGICLFAMLFGQVPFKGRSITELRDSIVSGKLMYPAEEKNKLSREARHLIKIMLRKNQNQRATIQQVLNHPWLRDTHKKMSIFSNAELKKIQIMSQPASGGEEPQRLLTEVEMTQRSLTESQKQIKKENGSAYSLDYGHKQNNVSERSHVLAPFNSTLTQEGFDLYLMSDVPIEDSKTIKFNDRVREPNRQYEFNYNGEVDNGIMISFSKEEEKDLKPNPNSEASLTNHQKPPKGTPAKPEESQVSTYNVRIGQQAKQKGMSGKPIRTPNAPMISDASLVHNVSLEAEEVKQQQQQSEIEIRPVINFNGLQQIGFTAPPNPNSNQQESMSSPIPIEGESNEEGIVSGQLEPKINDFVDDSDNSTLSEREYDQLNRKSNMHHSQDLSDEEEMIDNIIVCKIENEFGYPEEYLLECLKNDRKNDATTCYYLFCKEDKHELVNLLGYSPKQS